MTPDATLPQPGDPPAGHRPHPSEGHRGKFPPPLTPAQLAARRQADYALDERYAGKLVAYTDTWAGDTLDRAVLVVADTPQEFQDGLRKLDPEVRRRVEVTLVPDPDGVIAPSVELT